MYNEVHTHTRARTIGLQSVIQESTQFFKETEYHKKYVKLFESTLYSLKYIYLVMASNHCH